MGFPPPGGWKPPLLLEDVGMTVQEDGESGACAGGLSWEMVPLLFFILGGKHRGSSGYGDRSMFTFGMLHLLLSVAPLFSSVSIMGSAWNPSLWNYS